MKTFKSLKNTTRPAVAAATHEDIARARIVILGEHLPRVRSVLEALEAGNPAPPAEARLALARLAQVERAFKDLTASARLVDATAEEVSAIEGRGRCMGA